jgi:hypothetical protein
MTQPIRRLFVFSSRIFLAGALCMAAATSCNSSGTSGNNPSGTTDMAGGGGGDGGNGGGDGGGGTGDGGGGGNTDMPSTGTFTLSGVSPALGPSTGNIPLTLTGSGFSSNTVVTINGITANVTGFSATQLTVTLPVQLGTKGLVPIKVQNGADQVTRSDLFAYYYGRLEFESASKITVGSGPYSVVISDFNKDNKADVAVALYFAGQVAVLRGEGSGTLGGPVAYSLNLVSPRPAMLVSADINKDTYPDLITANYNTNNVSALLNKADMTGTFNTAVNTMSGEQPNYVAAADLTGDGYADAVVANIGGGSNDFRLLRGNSAGSLNAPVGTLYAEAVPSAIAIADVDKDGKLDLLLGNNNTGKANILTGDGTGTFVKKGDVVVGSQPWSFATADMDGDGSVDLISSLYMGNRVGVLLGTGTGSFGVPKNADLGGMSQPSGLAVGDFDADQRPDVAVALYGFDQLAVLRNTGGGNLSMPIPMNLGLGVAVRAVAVGDLNGDGKPDIVSANSGDGTISIILNKSQ